MEKKIGSSKNALKSGAYSRDGLLTWESAPEHKEHCTEVLADLRPEGKICKDMAGDMAENRWIRRRTRRMSAIATRRHPIGEMLEKSGPRSWQDALSIVRKHETENREVLVRIAESINEITNTLEHLTRKFDASDQLEEHIQKIAEGCSENWQRLARIEDASDQVKEFFEEYSPKRLHKRILLENALDAQYAKMRASFLIEQERRKNQQTANSPVGELHHHVGEAVSTVPPAEPNEGSEGLDLAELDRDDLEDEKLHGLSPSDALFGTDDDDEWAQNPKIKGDDD